MPHTDDDAFFDRPDVYAIWTYTRTAPPATDERDGIPHNLIAHPLLILCPPLGHWLHDHTEPTVRPLWQRIADRVIPPTAVQTGAISIEAIYLLILAAIAIAWFFGIHVTAAH